MPFTLFLNIYERVHTNENCMNIFQIVSTNTIGSFKYFAPSYKKEITSVFKTFLLLCIYFYHDRCILLVNSYFDNLRLIIFFWYWHSFPSVIFMLFQRIFLNYKTSMLLKLHTKFLKVISSMSQLNFMWQRLEDVHYCRINVMNLNECD